MKKIIYSLLILPLLGMLNSCDSEDPIVFDHEKPQFEIKADAILLEVIMPQGSIATDTYYIVGDFNGGLEQAQNDPRWQLEQSSGNAMKWGIFLYPSTFVAGKTLADGFTFHAKAQGAERSVRNEPVTHTLNVGIGTRTNVWVDRWESYFDDGTKDYFTIYVNDQTGWDALALYAWGDGGDVTPSWPGLQPTGTTTINGVEFTYFDMDKELNGVTMNLIFNNNGGGQQFDGPQGFTLDRDLYLTITAGGYEEIDPNDIYSGYTVYADDQTGWASLNLYAWADGGDVTPGWPGLEPTGQKEINGVTYTYFRMGEALNGRFMNLIFNGGGSQLADIPITLDRDFYFQLTASGATEVDPSGPTDTTRNIRMAGWPDLKINN